MAIAPALRPSPFDDQSAAAAPALDEAAVSSLPRRQVLKLLGASGATLLVAGVGVGSYRVFDTAALRPGRGVAYDPWQNWRDTPGPLGAVAAAILAATPHNTQPWQFAVGDAAIDLFVDRERNLGSLDPFRREQYVGLGCACENLALACLARGLRPRVTLLPDGPDGARVAHVALSATAARQDPRYDAIGTRHTNRGRYERKALSAATLGGLVDRDGLPGVRVHWITARRPMARLSQLMIDAAEAVVADEGQSRDGFAWFRTDDDAVQSHRDGLTLDAQALSPVVLGVAKLLPATTRSTGDTFWVDQTRTVHTATAAAYGILTTASAQDRTTQLVTGRLLQRIHLTATALGIALQPMNQVTERIDAERAADSPATFGPRLAALLPPGEKALIAFRVGYPEREARPSPRRPVSAVISGGPR